jgi:hypothetical protein
MSKISLTPNASGTGTFTIASPNGNTDRTINLPDSNGTILTTATAGVPVNGPAFSAYGTTAQQNVTASVATKVQLNAEAFDTNGNYDPTTNYRFTPTVAGYYQINYAAYPYTTITHIIAYLYKNGAGITFNQAFGGAASAVGSCLVYMNGTTDYLELYASLTGTTPAIFNRADLTYLNGFLARSAT